MIPVKRPREIADLRAALQQIIKLHPGDAKWARDVHVYAHVVIGNAKLGDQALLTYAVESQQELDGIVKDVEAEIGRNKGPEAAEPAAKPPGSCNAEGAEHAGTCQR